jgi:hypothetical protein
VSARSTFHRRDPDWEVDGPAARGEQRRVRARGSAAFVVALAAVAVAAFAWCIELGLVASLGIALALAGG